MVLIVRTNGMDADICYIYARGCGAQKFSRFLCQSLNYRKVEKTYGRHERV